MKWISQLFILGWLLANAAPTDAALSVAILEANSNQTGGIVAMATPKLTAGGKFSIVERQQVEKILREQQLATVLGSDRGADRISIGKLMQADLLVFLQPHNDQPPRLEVSIAETHLTPATIPAGN